MTKLKKTVLAGVAAVALATVAFPAHRAQALDLVLDPVQQAQGIQELAQWVEQIAWMKSQYDQLVLTYNALAHTTDMGGIASALGGLTRNFLPEAAIIPELMRDANTLWGRAGYYNTGDLYYASRLLD